MERSGQVVLFGCLSRTYRSARDTKACSPVFRPTAKKFGRWRTMQDQVPSVGSGAGRLGRPPNPLDPATSRRAELGAEVRRLRAARGLSLDALAKLVGCSSSHLSEVENGRKLPSVRLIQNLDRVLKTAGDEGLVERFWGAVA